MAIYHFSAKVISRANGSSAVASAAYRSAGRLNDERLGRAHDFSNKAGVVHSEILLPKGAPDHLSDRNILWNAVEAGEKRKDAQLAREVEVAIPREMDQEQGIALARDFVAQQFVARGMVADLNVHWDIGEDGNAKPHAHVMLSMREVSDQGFGAKMRDWNRSELLQEWREAWGAHVNERLGELGIDARIDHRSLEAQGIDLEPQHKIGPAGSRRQLAGEEAERADDHLRIARENGEKIIADPCIALDAITRSQATFTRRDLAMFAHRHSDGKAQFDRVMGAVRAAPDLVALGKDGRGEDRFTTRAMIETERRLERAADQLASQARHGVGDRQRDQALVAAQARGLTLSHEQCGAFDHILRDNGLALVVGYAGSGKSAMLGVARAAWEGAGYQVRGAALSGIAAENLQGGSGIGARTIASLEYQWEQGRELLTDRDVLVIDEAGMIGTRQMERVFAAASQAGAKLVLVGDPQQLQAIEAGASFRALAERHGAAEITEIRRQHEDWQREATKALATGRTARAINAYAAQDMVTAAATRDDARAGLVERWDAERLADPAATRIILTHTNAEVRDLNLAARDRLRCAGVLGHDVDVTTERGARAFATGDRIMFLKNERGLGVKNGTLGQVEQVSPKRMAVVLDDGRKVAFDLKDYAEVDHGYAATIHKSQGVTVDRAHVLATPGMDRHSAYVALSRHRSGVQLHYGRDDFADMGKLARTLGRERAKDMASDYARDAGAPARAFADSTPQSVERETKEQTPRRSMFDGLKLSSGPAKPVRAHVDRGEDRTFVRAVERVSRSAGAVLQARASGRSVLPHQSEAFRRDRQALDRIRPSASHDLAAAIQRNPALLREAAIGRSGPMVAAMAHEARVRTDPVLRADRFVERWQALRQDHDRLHSDRAAEMAGMVKSLERDPQMESILRSRARELGLDKAMSRDPVMVRSDLGKRLTRDLEMGRNRGLGR